MHRHKSLIVAAAVVLACALSGCSHSSAPAVGTQASPSSVDTSRMPGQAGAQIDTSRMPPKMVLAVKAARHQAQ
jgi:hypothetical protein